MNPIWQVVVLILRAIIPALMCSVKNTAEDASPQDALRNRLRERVLKTWGKAAIAACLIGSVLLLPGCFTRTIYVKDGDPVRIRKTQHDVPVWIMGADGKLVEGTIDLEEGWYALPVMPEK